MTVIFLSTKIKRFLASSKIFWKYRHIIQLNFFLKTYGSTPEEYFNLIFKNIGIKSVLDYGCATGEKLVYFIKKGANYVYGIDINYQAIQTAKKKIEAFSVKNEFSKNLNTYNLKKFLKKKKFDIILFERVLYILNDVEFYKIINNLSKFTKYIYIDDFFLEDSQKKIYRTTINGYRHTNYTYILKRKGFNLLLKNNSPYKKVLFANTKSALFVRKN